MGVLRSEDMKAGTLALPAESATKYINAIGRNVNMQFTDMHAHETVPKRAYKKYIQRIDELERIVRFLSDETSKHGFEYYKNSVDGFLATEASTYKLDAVEAELKAVYQQFTAFKANNAQLITARNAAIEEKSVVDVAMKNFGNVARKNAGLPSGEQGLLAAEGGGASGGPSMTFANLAGVIAEEDQQRFARFVFRLSRGNTYCNFTPIQGVSDLRDEKTGAPLTGVLVDPKTGKAVRKSVFVLFFQDSKDDNMSEGALYTKIAKAAQTFGVNIYDWPVSKKDADTRLFQLDKRVRDEANAQDAYEQYVRERVRELMAAQDGGGSLLEEWRLFCMKEKSVYSTLNCFEGETTLRCSVWFPANEEEDIKRMLVKAAADSGSTAFLIADKHVAEHGAPTYFRTNDFLAPFQELVNTYGIPGYKEATPVLFTIVTFPFIFGIMYGDVGHGGLLFLTGCWATWQGEALKYSMPGIYFARYLILMMGFFATYAGFLYNDFFGTGMNLFGSRWSLDYVSADGSENYKPEFDVRNEGGKGPYPFGVDPAWIGASNELLYLNSMKMKLSVLMGVAQMTVGVCLRFSNAIFHRSPVDFFCECCPMMVFMVCFFGYMDYMILFKWVTPADEFPNGPPSLINSLISMGMGQPDEQPLFDGSIALEQKLMIACLISVPWLLIPKPLCLVIQNRMKSKPAEGADGALPIDGGDAAVAAAGGNSAGQEEEFKLDEIIIHQIIETIEYVLGTVSHTASYLRQWALSLAHQQLSIVFMQKTLTNAWEMAYPLNAIGIFLAFGAWAVITLGVLLGMDVLECFLHTLRLHWVEFQSKFFHADGYLFAPFSYKKMLEHVD